MLYNVAFVLMEHITATALSVCWSAVWRGDL